MLETPREEIILFCIPYQAWQRGTLFVKNRKHLDAYKDN